MQALKSAIPFLGKHDVTSSYLPLSTTSSNRSSGSQGSASPEQSQHVPFLPTEEEWEDYNNELVDKRQARRRVRSALIIAGLSLVAFSGVYGYARHGLLGGSSDTYLPSGATSSQLPTDAAIELPESTQNDPASLQGSYATFRVSELPLATSKLATILPTRILPEERDCLEMWFAQGEVCAPQVPGDQPLGSEEGLSILALWVNGSDTLWQKAMEDKSAQEFGNSRKVSAHHYRDLGGLKSLMRSAVEAFKKDDDDGKDSSYLENIHILVADFPCPDDSDCAEDEDTRLGQLPTWMDWDKVQERERLALASNETQEVSLPRVQLHFHSEVFHQDAAVFGAPAEGEPKLPWKNEQDWKATALPNFNSFAIEAMAGRIKGLSDNCVLMNDDFYYGLPLSTSDFISELYGSMMRLDRQYGLQVKPILEPSKIADPGEWSGLQHGNWVLSKRFASKRRRYIDHLPKTLSRHMWQEASRMFGKDIALSSARPFREARSGDGDIEMGFLITHLRIERWREALLWTWAVAKVGVSDGGSWASNARKELETVLGLSELSGWATVDAGVRKTLDHFAESFKRAGWTAPKQSVPTFTSLDGLLPELLPSGSAPDANDHCSIDLAACFTQEWLDGQPMSAADMFKRLAFDKPECGDCLVKALVKASGERGLAAFLPPSTSQFTPVGQTKDNTPEPVPHLPLTREWQSTSFDINDVVTSINNEPVNLRTWTMKLLSRYTYTVASTPANFTPIKSLSAAKSLVRFMDSNRDKIAMGCINDDAPDRYADSVADVLEEWMGRRWPTKGWWEK